MVASAVGAATPASGASASSRRAGVDRGHHVAVGQVAGGHDERPPGQHQGGGRRRAPGGRPRGRLPPATGSTVIEPIDPRPSAMNGRIDQADADGHRRAVLDLDHDPLVAGPRGASGCRRPGGRRRRPGCAGASRRPGTSSSELLAHAGLARRDGASGRRRRSTSRGSSPRPPAARRDRPAVAVGEPTVPTSVHAGSAVGRGARPRGQRPSPASPAASARPTGAATEAVGRRQRARVGRGGDGT